MSVDTDDMAFFADRKKRVWKGIEEALDFSLVGFVPSFIPVADVATQLGVVFFRISEFSGCA